MRTVALVLSDDGHSESTLTALQLAERLLARGHRVTVFARESAASLATGGDDLSQAIAALLRRGVHGPTLDWVVDAAAADRVGADRHAPGVIPGGHIDVWRFIRDADVVLGQPSRWASAGASTAAKARA